MPEAYILPTAADIKRKSSIVPSGIGDSDGFPLFDNGGDDDAYSTPEDRKWGFRITGGAEFKMPITVFQVTEGSLAAKGGIKLGDIILKINEIETKNLSLAQAHEIVEQAESNLHLIAKKMEDENDTGAHIEEKSVVLRQPIELQNIQPPRELVIPQAERKVWHPVMWNHPPPAANEEVQEELPHHRIIRNIKRFFKDTEGKPETRQKYVEDMLLALPAHIQQRLRAMQRKLSEIAEIPVLIQSTLEAVSKTFGQFLTNDDHDQDLNVDSGSEDNFSEDDVSEIHSFSSYDHNDDDDEIYEERIKEDSPESDYITEDDEFSCDEEIPDLEIEEAQREPTPEPTEEDLLKQEKKEKILKVERSWPWGDREKIVYKISNCHLVPSVSLVQNRIKQLSESKIMSYYENKCKETV